jgi:SAM-dependent methyltransferase
MQRVSGLTDPRDFAQHGCDIFSALAQASPVALSRFANIIDFGVGSGRLARMFKGYRGEYRGLDVDFELIKWVGSNLPWVKAAPNVPRMPLDVPNDAADCVISISVFTHMDEADCSMYLAELKRVTRKGAALFLTVHGTRALTRALTEKRIADMLAIPDKEIQSARRAFESGRGFHFARQGAGHLTTEQYDYGITFINESYLESVWSKYFTLDKIVFGAIHDFQDIVVLRKE